jgi:hypothetical protein
MQGSIPAREGNASGRVFTTKQCRQLERDGYIVMDNFLTKQQVESAQHAIETLDSNYQFRGSPTDSFDDGPSTTRAFDRVIINRRGTLDLVRQQVSGFAKSLVDSDFHGFPNDAYNTRTLCVPAQMQVSICGGTETRNPSEESSTHNFYHKHLDSAGANNLGELGIIGWIRSRHLRQRYLTCIVYLNSDWKEGDGGCLRIFPNGDTKKDACSDEPVHVDVAPLAGRMVVFSSPTLFHVVLVTRVQRFACAVWLALE